MSRLQFTTGAGHRRGRGSRVGSTPGSCKISTTARLCFPLSRHRLNRPSLLETYKRPGRTQPAGSAIPLSISWPFTLPVPVPALASCHRAPVRWSWRPHSHRRRYRRFRSHHRVFHASSGSFSFAADGVWQFCGLDLGSTLRQNRRVKIKIKSLGTIWPDRCNSMGRRTTTTTGNSETPGSRGLTLLWFRLAYDHQRQGYFLCARSNMDNPPALVVRVVRGEPSRRGSRGENRGTQQRARGQRPGGMDGGG